MSEQTVKLDGWRPRQRPVENGELAAYRQLIVEAVFGVYYRKRKLLAERQMPPQSVSLREIYLEVCSCVAQLLSKYFTVSIPGKCRMDHGSGELEGEIDFM